METWQHKQACRVTAGTGREPAYSFFSFLFFSFLFFFSLFFSSLLFSSPLTTRPGYDTQDLCWLNMWHIKRRRLYMKQSSAGRVKVIIPAHTSVCDTILSLLVFSRLCNIMYNVQWVFAVNALHDSIMRSNGISVKMKLYKLHWGCIYCRTDAPFPKKNKKDTFRSYLMTWKLCHF